MNTQHFTTNDNQKFPLSTEALAFMQEQIKLAYGLTDLAGANIIVREPTASKEGLVIFDGELLPLTGTRPTGNAALTAAISIAEHTETMSVEGKFEGNVRTTRIASYTNGIRIGLRATGQQRKLLSEFTTLKSISTLMAELDEAKQHVMPKGSVIAWSGTCDCDHVPYGFIPCGGFFGGSASQFAQDGAGTIEKAKWETKYATLNISVTTKAISNASIVGVRIASCNGVTIPDLTDRFIVQAGMSYQEGNTGGANTVAITVNQMPKHNHNTTNSTDDGTVNTGNENTTIPKFGGNGGGSGTIPDTTCFEIAGGNGSNGNDLTASNLFNKHKHSIDLKASGGGQAHENRPPYYALCYLIKVI